MLNLKEKMWLQRSVYLLPPLVTLIVSPWSSYDPINLIKLVVLTTISFFSFGIVISKLSHIISISGRTIFVISSLFIFFMLTSIIFTAPSISQKFWGQFGRNNGFLSYLSLIFLMISAIAISDLNILKSIRKSLVFTSVPMTFYCLIQIGKLDPVAWSLKDVFGTLGNTNFLSSFMGMASIATIGWVFQKELQNNVRIYLLFLGLLQFLIIYKTGSIQGIMILIAGSGLLVLLYLPKSKKARLLTFPFLALSILSFIATLFALFNKGPLRSFIYQPTITFRTDYWHAGWEMTIRNPIFGVGLDSYGDWYRNVRGQISTLRTGPNRVSDTAHNIFLDISSGGGFPLLICYLFLIGMVIFSIIRVYRKQNSFNLDFSIIVAIWFAYQIQSLISINQIGVGVWGWILNGVIIGYCRVLLSDASSAKSSIEGKTKYRKNALNSRKSSTMSPSAGIFSIILAILGFSFSVLPFVADVTFKSGIQSRNLNKVIDATHRPGATAFHLENAVQLASDSKYPDVALTLAKELIEKYPRDFMGWAVIASSTLSSDTEKKEAFKRLHALDPFNPSLPKS